MAEFIKFLTYSIASNDETTDHLETLFESGSLKNAELYSSLHSRLQLLEKKLNLFIKAMERYKGSAKPVTSNQQL